METINVTDKELIEWVMKQPDERPVNMYETCYTEECGCVMVQYGKEVLDKPFSDVGFHTWTHYNEDDEDYTPIAELDTDICFIVKGDWKNLKTFGDVKKAINR